MFSISNPAEFHTMRGRVAHYGYLDTELITKFLGRISFKEIALWADVHGWCEPSVTWLWMCLVPIAIGMVTFFCYLFFLWQKKKSRLKSIVLKIKII